MARHSREEIEKAFEHYKWARDEASRTGDWTIWANCFTPDAHYIEHAYGELHGREAIAKWITEVMAPFPTMTFPYTWEVFDEKSEAYVFEALNAFPEPFQPDGTPYAFPTWTRLVYGGGGLWKSEEDVYNPARDAGRVFKSWVKAGGKTRTGEQVRMQHR
jgi:hypothetical protein